MDTTPLIHLLIIALGMNVAALCMFIREIRRASLERGEYSRLDRADGRREYPTSEQRYAADAS